MIITWLIGLVVGLVTFIFGLIPAVELPPWIGDAAGAVGTVFGYASGMGAWFPTGLVFSVLLAVLGFWAAAFVVRVVRMILSVFTGGGGS